MKEILKSQFLASLEMLKQAITECPDSLWNAKEHKNRFWHVAYHALFYTHLYLQPTLDDFAPWEKHREEYRSLSPSKDKVESQTEVEPFTKEDVLKYLAFCQERVEAWLDKLDFDAESGFYWLPFSKLELQLYNIRHIQQHTGELSEKLAAFGDGDVDWVGMKAC
jgi:hypothetical protein